MKRTIISWVLLAGTCLASALTAPETLLLGAENDDGSATFEPMPPAAYEFFLIPRAKTSSTDLRFNSHTGAGWFLNNEDHWQKIAELQPTPGGSYDFAADGNEKSWWAFRLDRKTGRAWADVDGKWTEVREQSAIPPGQYQIMVRANQHGSFVRRQERGIGRVWQAKWTGKHWEWIQMGPREESLPPASYEFFLVIFANESQDLRFNPRTGEGWFLKNDRWQKIGEARLPPASSYDFAAIGDEKHSSWWSIRVDRKTGRGWLSVRLVDREPVGYRWDEIGEKSAIPFGQYQTMAASSQDGDTFFRRQERVTGRVWDADWMFARAKKNQNEWTELGTNLGALRHETVPRAAYEFFLCPMGEDFATDLRFNPKSGEGWILDFDRFGLYGDDRWQKIKEVKPPPAGTYDFDAGGNEKGLWTFRLDRKTGRSWEFLKDKWAEVREKGSVLPGRFQIMVRANQHASFIRRLELSTGRAWYARWTGKDDEWIEMGMGKR